MRTRGKVKGLIRWLAQRYSGAGEAGSCGRIPPACVSSFLFRTAVTVDTGLCLRVNRVPHGEPRRAATSCSEARAHALDQRHARRSPLRGRRRRVRRCGRIRCAVASVSVSAGARDRAFRADVGYASARLDTTAFLRRFSFNHAMDEGESSPYHRPGVVAASRRAGAECGSLHRAGCLGSRAAAHRRRRGSYARWRTGTLAAACARSASATRAKISKCRSAMRSAGYRFHAPLTPRLSEVRAPTSRRPADRARGRPPTPGAPARGRLLTYRSSASSSIGKGPMELENVRWIFRRRSSHTVNSLALAASSTRSSFTAQSPRGRPSSRRHVSVDRISTLKADCRPRSPEISATSR